LADRLKAKSFRAEVRTVNSADPDSVAGGNTIRSSRKSSNTKAVLKSCLILLNLRRPAPRTFTRHAPRSGIVGEGTFFYLFH
jgi:hypothetical protein